MGQYDWVAEKKREAMMRKLMRRGMPRYAQIPVSERYGVSYTGLGPDGKLQKKAPAGIDYSTSQPHIFHEGETKIDTPEGTAYLNSDVTQVAMPMNEKEQDEMSLLEGRYPGYAAGGFAGIKQGVQDVAKKVQAQPVTGGIKQGVQGAVTAVKNQIKQPVTQGIGGAVKNAATSIMEAQRPKIQEVQRQQPVTTPAPEIQVQAPKPTTTQAPQIQPVTRQQPTTTPTPEIEAQAPKQQEPVIEAQRQPSAEEGYRTQGMEGVSKIATEGAQSINVEGKRMLDQQAAEQAAERDALLQQQAQTEVDPDVARAQIASLNARQEGDRNDLAAKYGIAGMQAQEQAYGQLANQGLEGQRFEQGQKEFETTSGLQKEALGLQKEQFEYGKEQDKIAQDWNKLGFQMEQGDFKGAADAFMAMTGNGVDMSKVEDAYNNSIQMRDAEALGQSINTAMGLLESGALDEQTAQALGGVVKKAVLSQIGLLIGDQFTEDDWADIDDVLNTDTMESNDAIERVTPVVQKALDAVDGIREWDKLQIDNPEMFNPDAAGYDAEKLGKLASALISQETDQLDDDERKLLKEYGVYNQSKDMVSAEQQQRTQNAVSEYRDLVAQGRYTEAKALYDQIPEGTLPSHDEMMISSKIESANGSIANLTDKERRTVIDSLKNGEDTYADFAISSEDPTSIENIPTVQWNGRRWSITPDAAKWVSENEGKIYRASNGKMYVVTGAYSNKERNSTAVIRLQDVETGKTVNFNNAAGKSASNPLSSEGQKTKVGFTDLVNWSVI